MRGNPRRHVRGRWFSASAGHHVQPAGCPPRCARIIIVLVCARRSSSNCQWRLVHMAKKSMRLSTSGCERSCWVVWTVVRRRPCSVHIDIQALAERRARARARGRSLLRRHECGMTNGVLLQLLELTTSGQ